MKFKSFAKDEEKEEGETSEGCSIKMKQEVEQVEEWETVTVEREQWVRLCDLLELLTNLSLLTGVAALREIPSIILVSQELCDDEELCLKGLKFKMLSNGKLYHLHIHVHVHVYMHTYIYIHVYMYVYIYTCT